MGIEFHRQFTKYLIFKDAILKHTFLVHIPKILIPFLLLSQLKAQGPILADSVASLLVNMEHIGTNDGLSQGLINGIVEDQLGYLWIATKDGLNRYDGNGFKVYRHDKQDPHSISENYVTDVFVDSQNRVWAATQTGGVNLLDRNTDRFFHFRNHPADPKSLSSDATGQILEDPNGNILIKTNSSRGFDALIQRSSLGLPFFDIVGLDRLYPAISAVPNLQFANSNIRFSCDGALWLVNRDTLYRFGPGTLTKGGIPSRFYLPQNPKVIGLLGNRGIFGSGSEELYIRGGKRLLLKYDATTDRFLPFLQLPEGFSFDLGALIDRKNRIWIWQSNEKIARVDLRDGAMTIIHTAWGVSFQVSAGPSSKWVSRMPTVTSGTAPVVLDC